MEGIQVSVEKIGPQSDVSVIRVGGYIDTTTSSELERALDSLLKAGVFRIIIDLGNVDYISSAGWGIFISEIKGIRERGGDLKLAKMIPDVYEVFELLEFHYILKAFDTIEDAIRSFDKDRGIVEFEEVRSEEVIETNENPEAVDTDEEAVELEDKIKTMALDHPDWGASRIAKELNAEAAGSMSLGSAMIRKVLKRLNLHSKKLRKQSSQREQ
jgi:anti-sigma B factor antagonist